MHYKVLQTVHLRQCTLLCLQTKTLKTIIILKYWKQSLSCRRTRVWHFGWKSTLTLILLTLFAQLRMFWQLFQKTCIVDYFSENLPGWTRPVFPALHPPGIIWVSFHFQLSRTIIFFVKLGLFVTCVGLHNLFHFITVQNSPAARPAVMCTRLVIVEME